MFTAPTGRAILLTNQIYICLIQSGGGTGPMIPGNRSNDSGANSRGAKAPEDEASLLFRGVLWDAAFDLGERSIS